MGGFQIVVLYMLIIAFVLWWLTAHTPTGRYLYAIGGNPEAARLSGVRIQKYTTVALVLSATVAGGAGSCSLAQRAVAEACRRAVSSGGSRRGERHAHRRVECPPRGGADDGHRLDAEPVDGVRACVRCAARGPVGRHRIGGVGGPGTYVWSVPAGLLPPGLSIRTDLTTAFPANASAGLVGVATTPGVFNFTLRVTSGAETVDRECTLAITSLTINDGNHFRYLPGAFVGTPYSYTLTALNGKGPVMWTATRTAG